MEYIKDLKKIKFSDLKYVSKWRLLFLVIILIILINNLFAYLGTYSEFISRFGEGNTNISASTVTINDSEADYNKYMALNYTEVTNTSELPGKDSDGSALGVTKKYTKNNLVKVAISYDGTDYNNNTLKGYVSYKSDEQQYKYLYYKYYYLSNGKITIDLIDNPFSKRPTGYGFNGWVCKNGSNDVCRHSKIVYDDTYYTRKLIVNINEFSSFDIQNDVLEINMNAFWVKAKTGTISSASDVTNVNDSFDAKSMKTYDISSSGTPVYVNYWEEEFEYSFKNNQTYYEKLILEKNGYYPAGSLRNCSLSNGTYSCTRQATANSTKCNTNGGCTYYMTTTTYDNEQTYYYYTGTRNSWGTTYYQVVEITSSNKEQYLNKNSIGTQLKSKKIGEQVTQDSLDEISTSSLYYLVSGSHAGSADYYDSNGKRCDDGGSCNSSAYKLIQRYDSYENVTNNIRTNTYTNDTGQSFYYCTTGAASTSTSKTNDERTYQTGDNCVISSVTGYYFLPTRDTNIAYLNATVNAGSLAMAKPHTLTGINSDGAITGTINFSNSYTASNDSVIENLKTSGINTTGNSNPGIGDNISNSSILANYHNFKIGRNFGIDSDNLTGYNLFGSGSSGGSGRFKVIVESGRFINIINGSSSGTASVTMNQIMIVGSDYDRTANNNSNLKVYAGVAGYRPTESFWSSGSYTATTGYPFISEVYIKSGSLGYNADDTANTDDVSGIYVGGWNARGVHSATACNIEGGKINIVVGGYGYANTGSLSTYISMTGGTARMIYGGAGHSTTYGDRIISVSGGTVDYSILGGSDSYSTNDSSDGVLTGDTLLYFGGNASVGGKDDTLYGVESGSIFGAGGGKNGYSQKGTVNNTHLIINGGTINSSVYGGGNYGSAGTQLDTKTTSIIDILDGDIKNSVYGGSKEVGFSTSSGATAGSNILINVLNGKIGNVYGGSNVSGIVYGTTNINIYGGELSSVYGGGEGTDTYVSNNVNVIVGSADYDTTPKITTSVYGGSAYGTVNGTEKITTASTTKTNVTINKGEITNVFGGGQGNSENTPYVIGDIKVTINDGQITNAFGANDQAGVPNGTIELYLKGGEVENAYGGGNKTDAPITNVYLQGSNCKKVFGGSNETGDVTTSNVTATSGTSEYIYGGNNQGGETTTSNVLIDGADVTIAVYGGGDIAETETTNVNLKSGTILDAYGGGKSASIKTKTNVTLNGAICTNIFGGSNTGGNVPESNLSIKSGTATNVYGANNAVGLTDETIISLTGGVITNVYGGGNNAEAGTSDITLDGTTVTNLYGGGNSAGLTTSNIDLKSGTAQNVFGGSNEQGNVTTSNIKTSEKVNTSTITRQSDLELIINPTIEAVNPYWQDTNYNSVVTLDVTVRNKTNQEIKNWSASITDKNSKMYSNYSNHDIVENNGTYTFDQTNKYDANTTFTIPASSSHNFTFTIYSKDEPSNFNLDSISISGTTANNDAFVQTSDNLLVMNIYGGNNEGGKTNTTNINLTKGYVYNVYGGGNLAPVGKVNLDCNGVSIGGQLYGGGNKAEVTTSTDVNFINSSISGSIYGGGNQGVVKGNTNVNISSSTIGISTYAGGNGAAAIVEGNTNITIDGTTNIGKHVFGGGNAATTGTEEDNNSISTVKIAGATIGGNVYGGANTSRVYGNTKVYIGYDAIENKNDLTRGNILIKGTVFGGGEANESGSDTYDFKYISVTKGIDIFINGKDHQEFNINGSIFGSGNASSTTGKSTISIINYGTINDIKENISLQRASEVVIDNSHVEFAGATDRTNEYDTELFSISRVDKLTIKNDTTLYLKTTANLLKHFISAVDVNGTEELAAVTINDDNKTVTKNVDNRLYMIEGKKLNIATNENVTAYGDVDGMTFFGMYQHTRDGGIIKARYSNEYDYNDTISTTELYYFTKDSYVVGYHKTNHDIEVDGFYTNYENEDDITKVKVAYIKPTPDDANYYMWSIGEQVSSYEMKLTASKYVTLGTTELSLLRHSEPNATFTVVGFNYNDLNEDVNLLPKDDIPRIADTTDEADKNMSLVMKTPTSGWMNKGETNFISNADNSVVGTTDYKRENTAQNPTLQFYLYHSKNISSTGALGEVVISLVVITPISDLESSIERVNVNIRLERVLYNTSDYEASISSGKHYSMFANEDVNITTTGSFSTYYSLFAESPEDAQDNYQFYQNGYYRTLVSDYALPAKTKITMIDYFNHDDPDYYYYVISDSDYAAQEEELRNNGEVVYNFSKFIKMGSTSPNNKYDDAANNIRYFDQTTKIAQEEFIFIVDFSESKIKNNVLNKSLLIELKDSNDQTRLGVLGIEQSIVKYNLLNNEKSIINIAGQLEKNNIYPGETVRLDVTTDYIQQEYQGRVVYDTKYYDDKLGIKITLYDKNNVQVTGASLLGVYYELDGEKHYPRMDGTVRIKIADKVSNVLARIKFATTNSIAPGNYKMKIESFGSPDGIYYGLTSSDQTTIDFSVLDTVFGLNVSLPEKQVIINKKTGKTLNDNNALVFNYQYASFLKNPQIRVSLKRRMYNEVNQMDYELVDLKDYVTNTYPITNIDKLYLLSNNPTANATAFMYLKDNLKSGTYRMTFSLYDGNSYIGEVYQYIIIK